MHIVLSSLSQTHPHSDSALLTAPQPINVLPSSIAVFGFDFSLTYEEVFGIASTSMDSR